MSWVTRKIKICNNKRKQLNLTISLYSHCIRFIFSWTHKLLFFEVWQVHYLKYHWIYYPYNHSNNFLIQMTSKPWKYCRFSYVGNWGIVKSTVGTKFWRSDVYLHWQAGNRVPITRSITVSGKLFGIYQFWYIFKTTVKWLCSSSLCIIDFCTKTDACDKIKYYKLFKNTKRQQENKPTSYREY